MPVSAAIRGSWPNVGTCTENDNINVSSDVDPSTNVEENDNLSCLENKIINEDNLLNVDFTLGTDNNKTLNIFEQKRNDFWYPPGYIFDWYKKISNIHLKDDILKEINDTFFFFWWCGPPSFMPPKFSDSIWSVLSKNLLMTDISRSLSDVQAQVFYSIKHLISIIESSRDDGTKTQKLPLLHKCFVPLI